MPYWRVRSGTSSSNGVALPYVVAQINVLDCCYRFGFRVILYSMLVAETVHRSTIVGGCVCLRFSLGWAQNESVANLGLCVKKMSCAPPFKLDRVRSLRLKEVGWGCLREIYNSTLSWQFVVVDRGRGQCSAALKLRSHLGSFPRQAGGANELSIAGPLSSSAWADGPPGVRERLAPFPPSIPTTSQALRDCPITHYHHHITSVF